MRYGKKYGVKSKSSKVGDKLVYEHALTADPPKPAYTGTIKTEIFETRDNEGVWKNRETTIKSDGDPNAYL